MLRQRKAYWYALVTVVFWSTSASAFKLALAGAEVTELLFWAALSSLLVLALILAARGQLGELMRWSYRDFGRSALLGLLNPFLYYLILFRAYDLLPAQEAQPLNFVWPIVLVLLSTVILGQRLRLISLLAMAISFTGVVVISTRGHLIGLGLSNGWGVSLALASTVVWSLYWLYGVRDQREPVARLCLNFAFGVGYILCYRLFAYGWQPPAMAALVGGLYIGLFEMGLAFVLWLQALKLSTSTALVGNLIYLTPFGSLLVIHWVLGEPILASTIVGLLLIVGGIVVQQYGQQLAARLRPATTNARITTATPDSAAALADSESTTPAANSKPTSNLHRS